MASCRQRSKPTTRAFGTRRGTSTTGIERRRIGSSTDRAVRADRERPSRETDGRGHCDGRRSNFVRSTVDSLGPTSPIVSLGIGRGVQRIAIDRLVLAVVAVFWTVALGTWGLGYVFTTAGIDGGIVFEAVRTIWFAVVYLIALVVSVLTVVGRELRREIAARR
ncbi:hypothetical protein [Natronobacterium gregoryi]|uniref:Uncharacterized protein n=1 Tax=Natronobacterium gregoryi (strain ATCC 43098 / DSM 3393 / CCM 3738 / CIP 104747 / IAM 13177 / JCM 8860 / NBRC 102187 / NCIMB 2189 / SP2) TaxID=797304 RepID=L9YKD7_NATGS|nr:hypothetical protein [Natronobacterium gregoryi]ELY74126.1 hypothetical protein C490_00680 [Natronobacterium gregoryi SP2]PLK22111.1 hypothetical protein CYV19_00070 [Natronobacterium gregoryi SP2]